MENKNVVLLTIIAVVTLLVAVIGATFAYFQVNVSGSTTSAVITAQTENVGTVSLDLGKTLHLNVSAEDMSMGNQDKSYYSTDEEEKEHSDQATFSPLATASLSMATPSSNVTTYSCHFKLTVTKSGTMNLENGDATLSLQAGQNVEINNGSDAIDLSANTITKEVTFTINSNESVDPKTIVSGSVQLNNTKDDQTDRLAGKTLNVTVSSSEFGCEIKAAS